MPVWILGCENIMSTARRYKAIIQFCFAKILRRLFGPDVSPIPMATVVFRKPPPSPACTPTKLTRISLNNFGSAIETELGPIRMTFPYCLCQSAITSYCLFKRNLGSTRLEKAPRMRLYLHHNVFSAKNSGIFRSVISHAHLGPGIRFRGDQ